MGMDGSPEPATGWGELLSGRNAARSAALAGGVALHAVNVFVAATILPSVVADIGGLGLYAWNTTAFVAASILGSALAAKAVERFRPPGAYRLAYGLFMAGSVAGAVAGSMPVLLAGRFVQGVGGGLLVALSFAMIRRVFAPALWTRAMALVSLMWGLATLLGPLVGGVFAELGLWRGAFWSLVPLTLGLLLLTEFVLPPSHPDGPPVRVPLARLGLLVLAVLAVSAASVSPDAAWNAAGLVAGLVLTGAFVASERHATARLYPRGAFSTATPVWGLYAVMGLLSVGMTPEIFLPLFLQQLHGVSPLTAGYMMALAAAGWTTAAVVTAGLGRRREAQAVVAGPFVTTAALAGIAALLPRTGTGAVVALVGAATALIGVGIGMGWPHLSARAMALAGDDEKDIAGASIPTTQLFCTALGAALGGLVTNLAGLSSSRPTGMAEAATWVFGVFALAPLLAGAIAVATYRKSRAIPSRDPVREEPARVLQQGGKHDD